MNSHLEWMLSPSILWSLGESPNENSVHFHGLSLSSEINNPIAIQTFCSNVPMTLFGISHTTTQFWSFPLFENLPVVFHGNQNLTVLQWLLLHRHHHWWWLQGFLQRDKYLFPETITNPLCVMSFFNIFVLSLTLSWENSLRYTFT